MCVAFLGRAHAPRSSAPATPVVAIRRAQIVSEMERTFTNVRGMRSCYEVAWRLPLTNLNARRNAGAHTQALDLSDRDLEMVDDARYPERRECGAHGRVVLRQRVNLAIQG